MYYRGAHLNCTGSLSVLLNRPVQLGCAPLYAILIELTESLGDKVDWVCELIKSLGDRVTG